MPVLDPEVGIDGELDSPDDVSEGTDVENPPSYGENNKDLPDELVRALKTLTRVYQTQEQFDRRREILRDWKNRLYSRGYQHVYEQGSNSGYSIAIPGAYMSNSSGDKIQCPSSMRNYNIFFPFERTITSVLTQNPPGIDFRPDNENDSEDVESAEVAEGYRAYYDRCNDVNAIQTAIVRMLLLSGRVVTWTRTEADAQKFGLDKQGNPKKTQTTDVYGTLESKVSILGKDVGALSYVILSDDPDVDVLKGWYPDFAKDIRAGAGGIGENEYERLARLGIMQGTRTAAQTGEALGHVTTRQMCFYRPCAFENEALTDGDEAPKRQGDEEGRPLSVRDQLKELFPHGCRVCFVGETYVGSWAESLDEHIKIDFPYAGDGMNRMAMMDPMIVIQDDFNDDMNAYWEVSNYGWPRRWIDAEDQDLDAITDQKANPYAYGAKKGRATEPLSNQFFQEPDPNIPQTLWAKTVMLMTELAQFILAAPPSLQGNSSPDLKTASAYSQARAQAMGQQGIPWMAVQRICAGIYHQAAKCAARDNPEGGEIVVPGEKGTPQTFQLAKLQGNFGCYPDQDSSFPESTQAKRANMQAIIQLCLESPQVGAQILGSPDNWELFQTLNGVTDLVLPEVESRNKQLAEISELLQNDPIQPSPQQIQQAMIQHGIQTGMAQKMGQPPPPPFNPESLVKSSVTPGLWDYHEFEIAKSRDWLSSEDRRRYEANGGDVDGIKNIQLHMMEHLQLKAQLDMLLPQAPPPPPVAPKGKHPQAAQHPTAAPNGPAQGAPTM